MAFSVNNFPVFSNTNNGLKELSFLDKIVYFFRIWAFRWKVPNQPAFFISRESWEFLVTGQNKHENWLHRQHPGFDLYGFVFCVAFSKDHDFYQKAYFRVRSILKNRITNEVKVETDNIAYVDLEIALDNQRSGNRKNCLKFISTEDSNPDSKRKKQQIDEEVIVKDPRVGTPQPPLPAGFIERNTSDSDGMALDVPKSKIKNEGSVFGKERIWDDLLVRRYPKVDDVLVSFAWHCCKKTISFDFKINGEFATEIPCPQPSVCTGL